MDTRLATRQYRLSKWADIVHDRRESGLNVNEYCRMHDLSRNAYYYWLRKLKENILETSGVTFAEIPLPPPDATSMQKENMISVSVGRAVINIPEGASKQLFSMIVEVLFDAERSE